MKPQETDPANRATNLPAGMTPEQMAQLEMQGIDPALYQFDGMPPQAELGYPGQAEAIEQLADVERQAIDRQHPNKPEETDALHRAELAQREIFVRTARENVAAAYGDEAAKQGLELGIQRSSAATQNTAEVAADANQDKDTLGSAERKLDVLSHDVADPKAAEANYAQLKDKTNGRSEAFVDKVVDKADHVMHKFGLGKRRKAMRAEAVEAAGSTITRTPEAEKVEQELAGEALIASLVDNKPHMNGHAKKELLEDLKQNPGELHRVSDAVRAYRRGNRKLAAYREVGKIMAHQR